ncbi:MAG: sulfide-dependent adenosine diphosphate thiazole synthase [Candidatus Nezhaarchaeota archaeon]|nr:sulfide-dependent adenosine diphosphate thiazole synthase [Candidatus Nezhaarchaeota archaeon]
MPMRLKSLAENEITRIIVEQACKEWMDVSRTDVVIVGAGPSGMTAAKYLAERGVKVVLFERRLSFGGGIGGGGMLFHKVVLGEPADEILREVGCKPTPVGEGIYVVDAAEMIARLASGAIDAGAKIIMGVTVDDVIYRENPLRIEGVCIQWSAVQIAGLHVDPIFVRSKAVIDATGHDAEVITVASRKVPGLSLALKGERSAYSELSEQLVVERTGKIVEGLYATGMAVAAVEGLPRMGPIFGSMLLSGRKVAEIVEGDLRGK